MITIQYEVRKELKQTIFEDKMEEEIDEFVLMILGDSDVSCFSVTKIKER